MRPRPLLLVFVFTSLFSGRSALFAQSFIPVTVTGFNHDVIAEAGPNSLVTTTMPLDGVTTSNMIIYTEAFRAFAGIGGGGIPDNGLITDGSGSYQLASYATPNCLLLQRTESGELVLQNPAQYQALRILCFSAEGASLVNATIHFTDGSSTAYINNYSLADWFNASTNIVISGYGRCRRVAAAPWGQESYPVNPRMYYMEINLSCTDQHKEVERISFNNVSPSSTGSIYPNAVFFALSGREYSQNIEPTVINSDCAGNNGSITLNITGSSSFYTYSWNTNPVQTGAAATGLAPGAYTCTITDAFGCTSSHTETVALNNNAVVTPVANPAAICSGANVQLSVTGVSLTSFSWSPGNVPGQTITVSPTTTTTYTVTGTNSLGCIAIADIQVNVYSLPASPVVNNVTVCSGANATLQVQNPIAGEIYSWYADNTSAAPIATGTSYTLNSATVNTTFYVSAANGNSCISASRTAASVIINANAALPSASDITVCAGDDGVLQVQSPQPGFTYNWYNAATGGTAIASGPSYTATNVNAPLTFYIEAINASGCGSGNRLPVTISLFQQLPTPVVTVSHVSFSEVTFSWAAIAGATGYEVTTDGGGSYQPPSSGATGTTHTIGGLTGNQTVSIQVRALGDVDCKTSQLSALVAGTTLSTREIFVPNVFTPNGDGRNDVLFVLGNYMATVQFSIFNQWGEKIFSTTNPLIGWDGSYKGKQQPVGVYVYALKVVLEDGVIVNKKGSISLIR